ncbi:MAG TPA: hypothetical protein VFJ97_14405 [Dermatophilaceae bacterium]|nr:hypothetical protein [Dermatophilaceae bacterium]
MTRMRQRWLPLTVLVAAVSLLVASMLWVARAPGGWQGVGMMAPGFAGPFVPGDRPAPTLKDAEQAAARFGASWGLSVGEVMQFDNGFYAELAQPSGSLATEVLVDPGTGSVQLEFGPAMMWNTAYGMSPAVDARQDDIGPERAQAAAGQWLSTNRPGDRAGEAEAFPGYYTLHVLRGDRVTGMLSVRASTGAVWYHAWHGRFVALAEHGEAQ